MKRITRKPFYLKTKLFYQTKINLWDQPIYISKFNKQKWSFLKNIKGDQFLDSFRFIPLSPFEFGRKRIRQNFKNSLYLRKLVRFKYARLKNYDLYKIFQKNKGYKNLIKSYGSRLDVVLYQLLYPISIFQLRQHLVHGKILLNGNVVKSPGIKLKPLDVLSFNLADLATLNFCYEGRGDRSQFFLYASKHFYFHSNYINLKDDEKKKFVKTISEVVATKDKYIAVLEEFFTNIYNYNDSYSERKDKMKVFLKKGVVDNAKKLGLDDFNVYLKDKRIIPQIKHNINMKKNRFMFSNVKTSFFNKKRSLGFFNNGFISDNFEILIKNNYIDCVFLGFSEEKFFINNNDKYQLHYLYK